MNPKYLINSILLAMTLPSIGQSVVTSTDSFAGNIDFTDSLALNKYNGPLSDITAIELIYNLNADGGTLSLDNEGDSTAHVTGDFGVNISVTGSSVNLLDGSFNNILDGFSSTHSLDTVLGANDGDATDAFNIGGIDYSSITSTSTSASGSSFVNSALWSQYIGSDTFSIDFKADSFYNLDGKGGSSIQFDSPDSANGNVTVKYHLNTPVPEPSSSLLLGLGALALMRRKR